MIQTHSQAIKYRMQKIVPRMVNYYTDANKSILFLLGDEPHVGNFTAVGYCSFEKFA
jgi:hypothetical protein